MTERKFLNFVLFEGILLSLLGILMLLLPKITSLTFGVMICIAFVIYGIYKVINSVLTRHYIKHFILNMILVIMLVLLGTFLFFSPIFNLILITSFIAVYFLLESLATLAFAIQNKKTLYFWWINLIVAFLQFVIGFVIIIGLPSTALWVIGTLVGINFLIAGMSFLTMFISTKNMLN